MKVFIGTMAEVIVVGTLFTVGKDFVRFCNCLLCNIDYIILVVCIQNDRWDGDELAANIDCKTVHII